MINNDGMDKQQDFIHILHQLNQPLTAINNYAHAGSAMLSAGDVNPERLQELFDKIAEQSARSADISKDLRQLCNYSCTTKG